MIYGGSGKSIPQRIVVQGLQSVLVALGIWLLLRGHGDFARRVILIVGFAVTYLRFTLTILYLVKRTIGWEEAISIPFAFAVYFEVFALLGRNVPGPIGVAAVAGVVLFAVGAAINTTAEVLRDRWKQDPAHAGRLYTGGLFRYAQHINYFGDVVWVLGLALICGTPWALIIPAALFCFFAFMNAPMLDRHLAERYGDDFAAYSKRTARIIPFVY